MLQKPAPAWDDETLLTAERELARALGPMAKVIVHRAAARRATARSSARCCRTASSIPRRAATSSRRSSGPPAAAFVRGHRFALGLAFGAQSRHRSGASGTAHAGGTDPSSVPLEQDYIDQITARLTVYIGPIAPIVTRKAAREAKGRRDFLRRVADNLGTQERAAFLHEVGYDDRR